MKNGNGGILPPSVFLDSAAGCPRYGFALHQFHRSTQATQFQNKAAKKIHGSLIETTPDSLSQHLEKKFWKSYFFRKMKKGTQLIIFG